MKDCNSKSSPVKRLFLALLFFSTFPSHSHHQLSSFYKTNTSSAQQINSTGAVTENPNPKAKRSTLWDIKGPDLESKAKQVETLTFFQSLLQSIAASKVKDELAEISSKWANTAQAVVSMKYNEVIHLTREAQEAQILSLERAATAQLLADAVSKASRVYSSSLARYEILAAASEAAEYGLKLSSEALILAQNIFSVRDKRAQKEKARALFFSTVYLRNVLEDLKATVEFAQNAHSVVTDMK